ncbi:hypothetical protein GE061_013779 [Apolygus lucorum]|uniref:PWWP domain-containing protein n=1 Tax=Apolygus lucorum TaxID=248454 RepID=A0A8S9XNN8_APOLU|nr:hypothetical protein GE061_013779 [Apolygus lucorum]
MEALRNHAMTDPRTYDVTMFSSPNSAKMSDMELGELEGEKIYNPEDVVWVKLSGMWWPAEVQDQAKLDPEVTEGLKKPPLCVVQFY